MGVEWELIKFLTVILLHNIHAYAPIENRFKVIAMNGIKDYGSSVAGGCLFLIFVINWSKLGSNISECLKCSVTEKRITLLMMSQIHLRPTPFEGPHLLNQCCGSVTLWYGYTDPDADPGDPKTYDVDLEDWNSGTLT